MVDYRAMKQSVDEKDSIEDHHQDKVDALKGRFNIELLSFVGICIGFTLSLYNVVRTHKQIKNQIKNLD